MTDVFKKFAPRWKNAVRRFAAGVWKRQDKRELNRAYWREADLFAREYRHALEQYFERKKIKIYRGTIDGKVVDWLRRQQNTQQTIETIAQAKKEKLVAEEFEKLATSKGADVQKALKRIYGVREGTTLAKGFTFGHNFEAKAEQIGDDEAFAFGIDINDAVLRQNGDRYYWQTQRDSRVRNTHQQLGGLCFLFDDPPTEVSKSGTKHTGNPGTAWGCRCFADPAPEREKPKRRFTVYEK